MADSTHSNSMAQHVIGIDVLYPLAWISANKQRSYGCILTYGCGEKIFEILVSDDPPPGYDRENTAEVEWARRFEALDYLDREDPDVDLRCVRLIEELREKVRLIAIPTLLQIAPPLPGAAPPRRPFHMPHTAEKEFSPDTVKLQLVTHEGRQELIPGHYGKIPREVKLPITIHEAKGLCLGDFETIPTFAATDVLLTRRPMNLVALGFDAVVTSLAGEEVSCKMMCSNLDLARQIQMLTTIRRAGLGVEARVPQLKGFVANEAGIIGIILQNVPIKFTLIDVIYRLAGKDTSRALKEKWIAEIEYTLAELHKHGIVWGEASPSCVLIDKDERAWLTGFGAGFCPPFVEYSMIGTVAGDLHALEMIKKKLMEGEKHPWEGKFLDKMKL